MLFAPYTNRELFSEHFLRELLPRRPEWTEAREAAAAAKTAIAALYAAEKKHLPGYNEAQLEDRWVRKILSILGGQFDVQVPLPTSDRQVTLKPDYAVFADAAIREEAQAFRTDGDARYYGRVALIGDAKRFGVHFQGAPKGAHSPTRQIAEYLFLTGVEWGLLTNGDRWRLVHRSTAGRLDAFYEAQLFDALASDRIEHFLYFFLFFRGEALRTARPGASSFLNQARGESQRYAEAVGEGLKKSVYDALRLLAQGYLSRYDRAELPDVETLRAECLALLYRLLFLFYAEHRELLPSRNATYHRYSLRRVAEDVARDVDGGTLPSAGAGELYGRLLALFDMVDRGSKDPVIPAYNGGLFSAQHHPLLAAKGPGDRDLARAIDLLARTRGDEARHVIDYRDLEIRNLGTIYEGILEYRLAIAEGPIVVRTEERGREVFRPHDPAKDGAFEAFAEDRRCAAGEAYLVVNRDERKTSGSFYTPDYIVEHVVAETLGPLVRGRTPEEILRLRVVDPAMGSGHFLLAAVDYLAQAYGQARIDAGQDDDGIVSDGELVTYRRIVVEHCIYGVDLNPMAVELAKLALWLKTMAQDRPLTFLDIHLKTGNSLLGVRIEQIGSDALARRAASKGKGKARPASSGQLGLFEQIFLSRLHVILSRVMEILRRESITRADVKEKERVDALIADLRRPFIGVADAQVAALFGVPVAVESVVGLLHQPDKLLADAGMRAAGELTGKKHFFHWELMFPEVFFTDKTWRSDAGFDAVIGNPPWVRQETLSADKDALAVLWPDVFHSVADIYVYFVGLAISLLAPGGRLGFVLPNKWQRADYGEAMRRALVEKATPLSLVDFGHAPVFPDADTFPCILIEQKKIEETAMRFCAVRREDLPGIDLTGYVHRRGYPVEKAQLRPEGWSPNPPEVSRLLEKIRNAGTPLGTLVGRPYRGILTGLNDAFLIDQATRDRLVHEDPAAATIIKKFLRGENVDRWRAEWGGEWMIFARRGIEIERYPSVVRHLEAFRSKLEPKPADWSGAWGGRKGGNYKWYEIQDTVDYFPRLEGLKLVYQVIQFHSAFALDEDGFYLNDKAYLVPISPHQTGALGVLNSSLMWWYMWFTAPHMKDEAYELRRFYAEQLPVLEGPGEPVKEVVALTAERQEATSTFLDWLRHEAELEKVSQKVRDFWKLDEKAFVAELKKAKAKLSPAALKRVKEEFAAAQARILPNVAKTRTLEARLHAEALDLYGITEEERRLMRETAPPRDPRSLLEQGLLP